jgi:hypothetical protein
MASGDYLFSTHNLADEIEYRKKKMREEIGNLTSSDLETKKDSTWLDYFEKEYRFDVPRIQYDKIQSERREVDVDVSGDPNRNLFQDPGPILVRGSEVIYFVPYEGDGQIFWGRPSTRNMNPPRGSVEPGELRLRYVRADQNGIAAKADFDRDLQEIQKHLGWAGETVKNFNHSIRADALNLLGERRIQLSKYKEMDATLGYPLRQRSDIPEIYAPSVVRSKVLPAGRAATVPASAATSERPSEPFLEMDTYEHILGLLSQMATVIERSPQAFSKMGEEDIRFVLLVPLNTHYEGQASAEAFNFEGKTDILIRADGKNIFIAECKFWRGPESLSDALDQLLGYASWRDTKTALLVFNRQKNFTQVLERIPDTVKAHPNFKRQEPYKSETGFRFVLHHRDDKSRELIVTVLAFEVPA